MDEFLFRKKEIDHTEELRDIVNYEELKNIFGEKLAEIIKVIEHQFNAFCQEELEQLTPSREYEPCGDSYVYYRIYSDEQLLYARKAASERFEESFEDYNWYIDICDFDSEEQYEESKQMIFSFVRSL